MEFGEALTKPQPVGGKKNVAASLVERGSDASYNRMQQRLIPAKPKNGRSRLRNNAGRNFHYRGVGIGFRLNFLLIGGRTSRCRKMKNSRGIPAAPGRTSASPAS